MNTLGGYHEYTRGFDNIILQIIISFSVISSFSTYELQNTHIIFRLE